LTILGGATGAADLALSGWAKELQQLQISSLSDLNYIGTSVSAVYQCEHQTKDDADIIVPGQEAGMEKTLFLSPE
jgi:hypothetical protein